MTINQDFFSSAVKSNFDSWASLSQIGLSSAEQTASLNFKTIRAYLEAGISKGEAVLGAHGIQELSGLQLSLAQPALESAVNYSRSLYEIISGAQDSIGKLAESRHADFNKSISSLLEHAEKNSPAGSEFGISAVKSTLSAANTAFNNLNLAGKRVAAIAEANVAAASGATVKAVSALSESSKRKAA